MGERQQPAALKPRTTFAVLLVVNVSAVGIAGAGGSGKPTSVAELRSEIETMKKQLDAVKNDPKTDCKTKDWQMQSLQRSIQAVQTKIDSSQAKQAERGKPVADQEVPPPDDTRGNLVNVMA